MSIKLRMKSRPEVLSGLEISPGQQSQVDVSSEDLAIFQYTGGTTGVSKAAMAQHKALVANMLQIEESLKRLPSLQLQMTP